MTPTPSQALLLFGLLARHGACPQAELMPAVKKADRETLAKAKLIVVGKHGRGLGLALADAGWAWTAAHLNAELPPAQRALSDILARLGEHLQRSGATLSDVIGIKPEVRPAPAAKGKAAPRRKTAASSAKASAGSKTKRKVKAPTPAALRKRIEEGYLALTGGRKGEMVPLARLRAELADFDRPTIDEALGRILKGDRKASLMRNDDPRQLSQADHDAAFAPSGEPFHIIWIAS